MQIEIELDDALFAKAKGLTGLTEASEVVRAALRSLVEREAARRLARLGGCQPGMRQIPRRRSTKSVMNTRGTERGA
jgi:Arc/MetJ family transcription regulator